MIDPRTPERVNDEWQSRYDALAARLAEVMELLRMNPNAYASDILETIEGERAPDQPSVMLCATCGHSYEQHHKGDGSLNYCRHCPCQEWMPADNGDAVK